MSERLIMPTWLPGMPGISKDGMLGVSATWISISRSSSSPVRSRLRKASRVESARRADKRVKHAFLGVKLRLGSHLFALGIAHEPDACLEQVAHDLVDVAADIADFVNLVAST